MDTGRVESRIRNVIIKRGLSKWTSRLLWVDGRSGRKGFGSYHYYDRDSSLLLFNLFFIPFNLWPPKRLYLISTRPHWRTLRLSPTFTLHWRGVGDPQSYKTSFVLFKRSKRLFHNLESTLFLGQFFQFLCYSHLISLSFLKLRTLGDIYGLTFVQEM